MQGICADGSGRRAGVRLVPGARSGGHEYWLPDCGGEDSLRVAGSGSLSAHVGGGEP